MTIVRALVLSDIHVPRHDVLLCAAVAAFSREVPIDTAIFAGDLVDLAPLGRFDSEEDDPAGVLEEMQECATFIRSVKARRKVALEGNHEYRFRKAIVGGKSRALRGLLDGLSVERAFRKAGLPKAVRWFTEHTGRPGLLMGRGPGRVLVRHGDRQASRFGGVNLCKLALDRDPGINQIFGHHHRAQMDSRSSLGRFWWAVSNPTMALPMNYSRGGDPNWQRGFTMIEWTDGHAVPTIILSRPDGSFTALGQNWRP